MANLKTAVKQHQVETPGTTRHGRLPAVSILLCGWLSLQGYATFLDAAGRPANCVIKSACGQEVPPVKSAPSKAENGNKPEQKSGVTPEQQKQIDLLINQLTAPKFSQRENAGDALLKIGVPALPSLRKRLETESETEAKVRINELIEQLIDGQIEVQIQDFMAMKPVDFDGWPQIRRILGRDSIATRALFVEILRSHPAFPASMSAEQTNRDRVLAAEGVIAAMDKVTQLPTTADVFALLLPLSYEDFELPSGAEEHVIKAWRSSTGTSLQKDEQLYPSFRVLLGLWMIQSSIENRDDILFHGMLWDMPECRILAAETILKNQNANAELLASCLQALAKFGQRQDVPMIRALLNDQRLFRAPSITTRGTLTHQVSDLALAAIACIYGVELEDVGFAGVSRDPRFGFLQHEIGFPKDAPEQREAGKKMVQAILKTNPTVPQTEAPSDE